MADTYNYKLWAELMSLVSTAQTVSVKKDFHGRCNQVFEMLENDCSGVVKKITQFAVDEASEAKYTIETGNKNLDDILNGWLKNLNSQYNGKIPVGVRELSAEGFKERWQGSSLLIMRIHWAEQDGMLLPDAIFFVDGSSVWVKDEDTKNNIKSLDRFNYYFDKDHTIKIPKGEYDDFIVVKPFAKWTDQYPSPYLVSNGVLYNFLILRMLKSKGQDVLNRLLPYLVLLSMGSDALVAKGIVQDADKSMNMKTKFKTFYKQLKENPTKVPFFAAPYDVKLNHIIPDLTNAFSRDIFDEEIRAMLSGLGFIEVMEGLGTSRRERLINPKPFISEVNKGVMDFANMLEDLVRMIIEKNKESHRKWFQLDIKVKVAPLKINVEAILEDIRGAYDRGDISIQSYQESLGFDHKTERERREYEEKEGLELTFYPHIVQNREGQGIDIPETLVKERQEKLEKEGKSGTEKLKYISSDDLIECKNCREIFKFSEIIEIAMGAIRCPLCEQILDQEGNVLSSEEIEKSDEFITAPYKTNTELPTYIKKLSKDLQTKWRKIFNSAYNYMLKKSGDVKKAESYAFRVANGLIKKAK